MRSSSASISAVRSNVDSEVKSIGCDKSNVGTAGTEDNDDASDTFDDNGSDVSDDGFDESDDGVDGSDVNGSDADEVITVGGVRAGAR